MKVRELIDLLEEKCDPDDEVIMSSDSEGNNFSPLEDYSTSYNYNDGEIGLKILVPIDIKNGYTEEDVMEDGVPCIILWP